MKYRGHKNIYVCVCAYIYIYNHTHVILSEGRRNWPIAGFPFVGDADRLRRFLLHRFRLIEQRQLVKLLDICNSPENDKLN